MTRKTTILCILLFGILVTLDGCSRIKSYKSESPGWIENADKKITLDWYINFSWFDMDWGENLVSKTITEETGISVNFILPSGSEKEKLNTMIQTDNLPDLITLGWWENQVDELIIQDKVYALNELAKEYDPYFLKVTGEESRDWFTQEDGNLYCYPNTSYTPKDYESYDIASNQTFLVRKDIYEAIGRPDMTTPDGFVKAVKAAKDMFPAVNGEPLIPIGAHEFTTKGCDSFDEFLMNFLAIPYEKEGAVYDRYTDPEYIRWLKTFRQLGEEGFLAQDIFVDKRIQMEEKLYNGRYFCMLYQRTDIEEQQIKRYREDADSIYIAVDGPKNSKGDAYKLPGTGINGWTVTLISKRCKNPDRAIQFMSYLLSERGQRLTYLGIEDITYEMQNGKPVLKEEARNLLDTDRAAYDRKYGAFNAYWMLQNKAMQFQWKQEPNPLLEQMEKWTYPYVIYIDQYDKNFKPDSREGAADIAIEQLWGETLPRLLLSESETEFEQVLVDFIKKRQEYGFDMVMEERTRQMKRAKEKLGLE